MIKTFFVQDVLPIARKLGERVLVSCAAKLKPYLLQAVEAKSISLNDYSKALASICQDAIDNGHNEVQATGEHKVIFYERQMHPNSLIYAIWNNLVQ